MQSKVEEKRINGTKVKDYHDTMLIYRQTNEHCLQTCAENNLKITKRNQRPKSKDSKKGKRKFNNTRSRKLTVGSSYSWSVNSVVTNVKNPVISREQLSLILVLYVIWYLVYIEWRSDHDMDSEIVHEFFSSYILFAWNISLRW